jgi:sugar phosphate isomerase/epimerase
LPRHSDFSIARRGRARPVWYTESMDQVRLSRRGLLAGTMLAGAALPGRAAGGKLKVAIFSKHLPFVRGEALAQAAADVGFDGVDITVRAGGHVAPERVRQELPPLVAAIRRHGLEVPMITTDIADLETPHAEDMVAAAAGLGIRYYRFGAYKWAADRPYPAQLDAFRPRLAKLAALNAKYQTCAMYHIHSGVGLVGASVWDLYLLMRDLDPKLVGVNYDVAHATIEGGLGGWIDSFHITGPHLRGIAVKDFIWAKNAGGRWAEQWMPIGQGMVRWREFFAMVAQAGFDGPLQVHFEYPLGPAPAAVYAAMKTDLATLRGQLAQAGL